MKIFKHIIIIVFTISLFASCNPQKQLAREFIKSAPAYSVMLMQPEFLYKANLNTYYVDSLAITDEKKRDSILWIQSEFIRRIDDSLLIANYALGFENELKNYKINVFDQTESDKFFSLDSNAWMVNIAQMQIEEEKYEYRDETEYYNYVYYHDHILNAVNVNSWFEISMINSNDQSQNVYYATNTITDDLESSYDFDIFDDKVKYYYEIDSLNLGKIYEYSYLLGRIYATYTFDFIMNNYVSQKQGYPLKKEELLRYVPYTGTFFPAGENRFISLDE
ncbi:MAG: hypothetical protein C0598_00775 [Marinilabiliales bacterium]|nr:MAG: hypothetical protein C0598_00775 [Marinilabiliales bacterium]